MKYFLQFGLLSILILTSACKKKYDMTLNNDYVLDIGHTISFNDDDLKIHFDKMEGYFICPENADCEAPDYVHISIVLSENGVEERYGFSNLYDQMSAVFYTDFGNYNFEIEKINPFPEKVNPDPYEFSVEFSLTLQK